MATPGGMGGGLAGDKGSENYSPIPNQWSNVQADAPKAQGMPQKQPKMNLTPEEMQALQECSRESFYYRCIPLGILMMGGTQILVNKQFVRPHPRLGALPKTMFAGLVAYLLGKVSYQGECRRKIMMLPNSPLGQAMREGKKGRELMTEMAGLSGYSGQQADQSADSLDPINTKLSEDYIDSAQGGGLDDNKRPTVDSMAEPTRDEEKKSFVTYDDLRKRNRADHETRSSPSNPSPLYDKPTPSRPQYTQPSGPRAKTNKYGDLVEE